MVKVEWNGSHVVLPERLGRMVMALVHETERIVEADKGKVTFDFAGDDLSMETIFRHQAPRLN